MESFEWADGSSATPAAIYLAMLNGLSWRQEGKTSFECVCSRCQDPVSLELPHLDSERQLFNNKKLIFLPK